MDPAAELTAETRKGKPFMRAKARIYDFLSQAPSVTQAGISFSFSDEDRKRFREKAESLRLEADGSSKGVYGYQGEDL